MNCSELIANLVKCKHVFLLPGGGNLPLVEAFGDRGVPVLHEHTAAVAAEAYAQLTGFGCALVTTGPGVTNAMTGLAAAWLDSTPMLLLSGQVKDEYRRPGCRQGGFQELPEAVTGAVTVATWRARCEYILQDLTALLHLVLGNRDKKQTRPGPAHFAVPLNVQTANVDREFRPVDLDESHYNGNTATAAERCAELLKRAERPMLLLGHGARYEEVRGLVEAIGLPTLLTWRAADFLEETHPLFCGRPGIAGQRGANIVQQKADLLVCVGARLDIGQCGYDMSLFAPDAMKLVIDIDEAEARKHVPARFGDALDAGWLHAVCDGPSFLRELAKVADKWHHVLWDKGDQWLRWCKDTYTQHRPRNAFYDALSEALRPDDVIVAGSSGTASESTLQHIRIKRGQRLVFSPGLGSMGFGLPASIGACLATGRRVVCIEGDGSFAMNAYELETVRKLGLPIKLFVIRNGGYASIVRSQRNAGYASRCPSVPDPMDLAGAYEMPTYPVSDTSPAVLLDGDWAGVFAVDTDCSLSHRMRTIPPGKPEDMVETVK